MSKPSIFSRDYEKRMKKRKIRIALIIGVILIVGGALLYNFKIKNMDFSNVRNKLQAWVDSDKKEEPKAKAEDPKTQIEEKPVEEEKTFLEIELPNKEKIKVQYEVEDNKGKVKEVEDKKGYDFDVSPDKDEIIALDKNQNMYLIKLSKEKDYKVTDITKKQYVSKNGTKFPKDTRLEADKNYKWHAEPKFINEDTIIYVSQLPFFGTSATKEYVWIYDISSKEDKVIFKLSGKKIDIGDIKKDKGIEVNIDKNEYIIDDKGNIVK
ncbi:MAG: hypothetical protein ACRDCB_09315 [Clostridium sp.]